jgi:preprotein translocase subunit SecD
MPRHASTISLLAASVIALSALGVRAVAQPLMLEVVDAAAAFDARAKEPSLRIRLSKASAAAFGKFTTDRVGQWVEMRRDGQVVGRFVLREPITGGFLEISGRLSAEQTSDLASRLPGSVVEVEIAAR